jgi:hypothetical protein
LYVQPTNEKVDGFKRKWTVNNVMEKFGRKLFWTCGHVARLYCCIHPARPRKISNNDKQLKYMYVVQTTL